MGALASRHNLRQEESRCALSLPIPVKFIFIVKDVELRTANTRGAARELPQRVACESVKQSQLRAPACNAHRTEEVFIVAKGLGPFLHCELNTAYQLTEQA